MKIARGFRQRLAKRGRARYYTSPNDYWDRRHRASKDSLVGVGYIGMSEAANVSDYDEKWRHIQSMLGSLPLAEGSVVLDAGCGVGYFAERIAERGFVTHAVDFSAEAIEQARASVGRNQAISWHVASIDQFDVATRFDAVLCIDVLFHVTDDEVWAASVANLAQLVVDGGWIVVQDELREAKAPLDSRAREMTHVRRRTLADYHEALDGLELVKHEAYGLGGQGVTKDLLCFQAPVEATSNGNESGR